MPLNISDHTIVGSLSQEAQNEDEDIEEAKPSELNLSAISNSSSVPGSSLVHSTPSPEVITQHRNGLRRYHSEERGARRSLGGQGMAEAGAGAEKDRDLQLGHCDTLFENSFQSEQQQHARGSLSNQRSITQ
jgi:hypothetical protein